MTSVKFNKKVTAIKDNSLITFRTKKDFWNWASTQNNFTIDANTAKSQIINKIIALGFNFEIDDSWGFDFDFRVIVKK